MELLHTLPFRFLHRLWKDAVVCTQILEGHSDAITSTRFINKGQHARNNNFLLIMLQKASVRKLFLLHCRIFILFYK